MLEQDEEETATASQEKGANGNGSGKANDVARRGFTSEEEGRKALEQIKDAPFTITSVTKKNGTEAPPRLYDLTSLQVECNRKFFFLIRPDPATHPVALREEIHDLSACGHHFPERRHLSEMQRHSQRYTPANTPPCSNPYVARR